MSKLLLATQKGTGKMKKKNIGSTFDSWLREEGVYEKVTAAAIKRVVAREVGASMQQEIPTQRKPRCVGHPGTSRTSYT
jgi:hypothetical protein